MANRSKLSSPASKFRGLACCLTLLLFAACGSDPLEIRPQPGPEHCMESRFTISGDFAKVENGIRERPVTLELLQEYMENKDNLAFALARKKYIVHYYQRLADWDQEIVPAKFPLYWEIDSTALQTEGTFLLTFQSKGEVTASFACEECAQINPSGERIKGKRSHYKTQFDATTQSLQKNEDWAFKIRPRKIQLEEEVGKQYLVKVESRETYLSAAKQKLQLQADGNSYRLRFSDPFAYRAENFTKALCIAMVNQDQMARKNAIDETLEGLAVKIDALQASLDSLGELSARDGKSGTIHTAIAGKEKLLSQENDRKAYWQVQRGAFIPRFLVVNNAYPCGKVHGQ